MGTAVDGRLERLSQAVAALVDVRVDLLTDGEIDRELGVVEGARRALEHRQSTLVSTRARRARERAARQRPGDQRVRERAERDSHRQVAGLLNWTHGQARRASQDGQRLEGLPQSARAARNGEISTRHSRLLRDTLVHFSGAQRDALERELLEAARGQNPVMFGRTCRRRLAELNPQAAVHEELRKQAKLQKASVTQTDQGSLTVQGEWTGLDAEYVATAVHAFRRPDRSGEHRPPERRTADAIVDVCKAALDAAKAPSNRGARPHVIVRVDAQTIFERAGVAEGPWTGGFPWELLRQVLDDAGLGWLPVPTTTIPLESTPGVRTVPRGLYRYLQDRDRECIRDGCDMPASFCDVMHLNTPHRHNGRLSPNNAALGCRRDHRDYDAGRLELYWKHGRPHLRPFKPGQSPTEQQHVADEQRQRDGPDP